MLKCVWTALLDVLFPPRCPICHEAVRSRGQWCTVCLDKILCRRQIDLKAHHMHVLESCQALCLYRHGIMKLIRRVKYQRNLVDLPYLLWLLREEAKYEWFGKIDIVTPVPLCQKRLEKRGFNQAETFFRAWAERNGWLWQETLVRCKVTLPQYQLSKIERRENVQDAFSIIYPEAVAGKNILLVDDILATGFTMAACARALKQAGAQNVKGFVLATDANEINVFGKH